MKSLALFNPRGGVGKTTLTFNIAHMLARLGTRVAVMDCDPQCALSAMFLDEEQLENLWDSADLPGPNTVARCVEPVRLGQGDVLDPILEEVANDLWLLPGHLSLSRFEQTLAQAWCNTLPDGDERPARVVTSLDTLARGVASTCRADVVMIDVGPNLDSLHRAVLLASDQIVIPLAPDVFGVQALKIIGPTLTSWRNDRHTPRGRAFLPAGYILQQHLARSDRPARSYERWARAIASAFHRRVLEEDERAVDLGMDLTSDTDPACIATIRHFASLVPMARAARKPLFDLKQADGVSGAQVRAVLECRQVFEEIAREILVRLAG